MYPSLLPLLPVFLLLILISATISTAAPTFLSKHQKQQLLLQQRRTAYTSSQHALRLPAQPVYPSAHAVKYLDVAPNTIGLLLTTTSGGEKWEEEALHLWLPVGEKVFVRDMPFLPLHPITARITRMIASTPDEGRLKDEGGIVCRVFPTPARNDELRRRTGAVVVSRSDGLVHIADELEGVEVEAYECS